MRVQLNKTRRHSERYWLKSGNMGGHGDPKNHANNNFEVVNGIDQGNGYHGYMSVSYALSPDSYMPKEARITLRKTLTQFGYCLTTLLKS